MLKKIFGTWAGRINNLKIKNVDDKAIILDSGYYDSRRKDLEEQLDNSIQVFDLFFINLIRINDEITKSKHFLDYLNKLDGFKKDIVIGHMILVENEDLNNFLEKEDFATCFDTYKSLVEEYLDNDNKNNNNKNNNNNNKNDNNNKSFTENLFSYKISSAISKLNNFKHKKQPAGLLSFASKNKQTDSICSLTQDMIQILEQISTKLNGKDGGSVVSAGGAAGMIEKVLNGDIKVPDKLQKIIYTVIQSFMG